MKPRLSIAPLILAGFLGQALPGMAQAPATPPPGPAAGANQPAPAGGSPAAGQAPAGQAPAGQQPAGQAPGAQAPAAAVQPPPKPEPVDPAAEAERKKAEEAQRKRREELRLKAERESQCIIRPVMTNAEIARCRTAQ